MNLGDSHDKLVFLESDEGAEKNKSICACGMSVASGAQGIQTQLASLAVICATEFNCRHTYRRYALSARAKHGIPSITHYVRSLAHLCLAAFAKSFLEERKFVVVVRN
jgi:hypothetical protein